MLLTHTSGSASASVLHAVGEAVGTTVGAAVVGKPVGCEVDGATLGAGDGAVVVGPTVGLYEPDGSHWWLQQASQDSMYKAGIVPLRKCVQQSRGRSPFAMAAAQKAGSSPPSLL